MTLVTILVLVAAFVLLWFAIKGETPAALFNRAFNLDKAKGGK